MKYCLLFSVLIFTIVSLWVIKFVGRQNHLSLSVHVAKSRMSRLVFGIVGVITTTIALVSVLTYTLPHVSAHYLIYDVFIVVFAQFFVTVLLPYVENTRRGLVHNIAAWGMCLTIPLSTALLLFTDISTNIKTLTSITLILEIILLIISLGVKSQRKYFLIYQMVYLGLFFGFLLILTWN